MRATSESQSARDVHRPVREIRASLFPGAESTSHRALCGRSNHCPESSIARSRFSFFAPATNLDNYKFFEDVEFPA